MEVLRCVLGSDHGGIVHVHLRTPTRSRTSRLERARSAVGVPRYRDATGAERRAAPGPGPTCASRREPNEGASHVRPLAERRAVPHSVRLGAGGRYAYEKSFSLSFSKLLTF